MGHASAAMTSDVYSHLWPDSDERSRTANDACPHTLADSAPSAKAHVLVRGVLTDFLEKQ